MCGLAAIFSYRSGALPVEEMELLRIREAMAARGPDGAGLWLSQDRRVGLAHRRLSIIDLSEAGAQPMATPEGDLRIVFNGEIYNYRALRRQLEDLGHRFVSHSDTEVLLHGYREYGRSLVHRLRGMYAFVLWDEARKGLFLARDPLGIKPLYYADDGATIRAASQVKALLAGGCVDTAPEPAGHVGFFLWGHVPEPYTLYKGIRALPPGSTLWVDGEHRQTDTFFRLRDLYAQAEAAMPRAEDAGRPERLAEALRDTVRHHLIADVPVGVFLSSGIDSTSIAALTAEALTASGPGRGGLTGKPDQLRTVTLAFSEFEGTPEDESPLAETVARRLGARHVTRRIAREDFEADYPKLLAAMDQPSIDGVNTWFVSKATREAGLKVALSGLGGDEIFGGYSSFHQIPAAVRRLRPFASLPRWGRAFRVVSAPLLRHFTSPKYAGLLEYGGGYGGAYLLRRGLYMPWELPRLLDPDLAREGWAALQTLARLEQTIDGIGNPRLKVSALETEWYMRHQLLRDADWASMAHGLELRVPFVDAEFLRSVAGDMASSRPLTKRDMTRVLAHALPEEVIHRPKTGFTIPVQRWASELVGLRDKAGYRPWAQHLYHHMADVELMSSFPGRTRCFSNH
ncbi:asparagine synthase (glutamine-hydrolysing) [Methylococcus capsulatus]|uniref:asparagine synthase (glutamine-hydrolyzing) n=1 Tax=Methylococcus capsulatus TaxID=414 RepID=A0AA35XZ38_METCP|nr:asparagine synthase (glutamine-hydrolyzing) [Methylococcus capsulatus]CAI8723534.1 asparagine synthase (glutamine-hydrolysing) [Methylococcus capsulatus]